MEEFNGDFHLHGPRSIGVSKHMDLPHLVHGARQKGLHVVATGDCLQPDWLRYLKENLVREKGVFHHDGMAFVLQTEVEDAENVHDVILLPDFDSIDDLKKRFRPHSSNIDHEWGGRPRVSLSPGEIVEHVTSVGGLAGPAHAFTPFKSVFRQGKYDSLASAYGNQAKNVHFLELGLSANTDYADRIKELHRVTFMSNSDAHAPSPVSLGREFNTFLADSPSFEEIDLAIRRKDGRKFTRNVGFDPKLGKYNVLFCNACRRRVLVSRLDTRDSDITGIMAPPRIEGEFIHVPVLSEKEHLQYQTSVSKGKISCPACARDGKKAKIKLGVSDRVVLMADTPAGVHPDHRPPYVNIVPLVEMLRVALGVASSTSKVLDNIYTDLVGKIGPEIDILLNVTLSELKFDEVLGKHAKHAHAFKILVDILQSFRENKIEFKPGGGGTFGELVFEA